MLERGNTWRPSEILRASSSHRLKSSSLWVTEQTPDHDLLFHKIHRGCVIHRVHSSLTSTDLQVDPCRCKQKHRLHHPHVNPLPPAETPSILSLCARDRDRDMAARRFEWSHQRGLTTWKLLPSLPGTPHAPSPVSSSYITHSHNLRGLKQHASVISLPVGQESA